MVGLGDVPVGRRRPLLGLGNRLKRRTHCAGGSAERPMAAKDQRRLRCADSSAGSGVRWSEVDGGFRTPCSRSRRIAAWLCSCSRAAVSRVKVDSPGGDGVQLRQRLRGLSVTQLGEVAPPERLPLRRPLVEPAAQLVAAGRWGSHARNSSDSLGMRAGRRRSTRTRAPSSDEAASRTGLSRISIAIRWYLISARTARDALCFPLAFAARVFPPLCLLAMLAASAAARSNGESLTPNSDSIPQRPWAAMFLMPIAPAVTNPIQARGCTAQACTICTKSSTCQAAECRPRTNTSPK